MTPSILLPVSINAVAMIVKLPPSSVFLAAPKNFFGFLNALESTPPDKILPLCAVTALCALPKRVMLSNNITTSLPHSTSLCAFFKAIFDT